MACKRSAVRFRLAPPIAQPIHNRNMPPNAEYPLPRPLCPGVLLLSGLFIAFLPVHAAQATDALPDAHAPIGVMADHMHKKGRIYDFLRRMSMRMKGNYADNDKLSDAAILMTPNTYGTPPMLRVVPQNMDMTMTMIGAMYAPSDKVTLLAMVNLLDNDMRLTTYNMNAEKLGDFDTSTSGLGDSVIGALFDLPGKWHSGLAFGLPTGATDRTGRHADADEYACHRAPALCHAIGRRHFFIETQPAHPRQPWRQRWLGHANGCQPAAWPQ